MVGILEKTVKPAPDRHTSAPSISICEEPIPAPDYLRLVADAGWTRFVHTDAVDTALKNSLWSAVARDQSNGAIIGCIRIVGDGAIFFYIQDLIVAKAYRKRGIGRRLMEHADRYLKRTAPRKAWVGLFTHPTKAGFYEKFAFHGPRPSLVGMYKATKA